MNVDSETGHEAPKRSPRIPSAAERIDEAEEQIPLLDASTFVSQVLDRPEASMVIFYLAACSACHALFVRLRRLTATHGHGARIFRVEAENSREIAVNNRISNVPTLITFSEGKARSRVEGLISEPALEQILDSLR